jgi:hypothetical protein
VLVVNKNDSQFLKKKIQLVRLLLQYKVNLDLADVNGNSATHNLVLNCPPTDKTNLFVLFYLLEARERQSIGSGLKYLHAKNADGNSIIDVRMSRCLS